MDAALGGGLESRLRDGLLTDAIPLAQAAALNAHPDDPQAAAEALTRLLEPLSTSEVLTGLGEELEEFVEALEIVSRLDTASPQELGRAKEILGLFESKGPFGTLLTGSLAVYGLITAAVHFKDGEWPPGVVALLESVEGGYEVFSRVVNVT